MSARCHVENPQCKCYTRSPPYCKYHLEYTAEPMYSRGAHDEVGVPEASNVDIVCGPSGTRRKISIILLLFVGPANPKFIHGNGYRITLRLNGVLRNGLFWENENAFWVRGGFSYLKLTPVNRADTCHWNWYNTMWFCHVFFWSIVPRVEDSLNRDSWLSQTIWDPLRGFVSEACGLKDSNRLKEEKKINTV